MSTQILVNEYLIEVKKDIKKSFFISTLNEGLKEIGFSIDTYEKSLNKSERLICIYEVDKIYHINKKTKNIFILLKLFYVIEQKSNSDICNYLSKYIQENSDILRFRESFLDRIKKIDFIENIITLQDKYKFCILKKSYPIIYNIENSMRSLISKTMSFLAKREWQKSEIPEQILSEMREDRKHLGVFGTDFSHLSRILFDRTGDSNINNLFALIESLDENNISLKDIEKIKNRLPKSNWKKYFSEIIIEDDLKSIKSKFYKNSNLTNEDIVEKILNDISLMRNKIAHNSFDIKDNFYEELKRKSSYVQVWIDNATNYLEERVIEDSKHKIKNKLSKNEEETIKKIDEMIKKVSMFYAINEKKLDSFIFENFYFYDDEKKKDISKYKCIKDIKFFLRMKSQILNEDKALLNDDFEKYLDDIDDLIANIDNCPYLEDNSEDIVNIIEE